MLRKINNLSYLWLAVTMSILLALRCDNVSGQDRIRHGRTGSPPITPNSTSEREQLEREFEENNNEIHNELWNCGVPKPKLVYLHEALETLPPTPPSFLWVVEATVMHRCEPAFGCCTIPKKCKYVNREEVNVTFKMRNVHTGDNTYYRIPFYNHTSCACQSDS